MRNILFFLLLVPMHLSSQSARLHGVVTILNSRFDTGQTEYLAGVQIAEIPQPDSLSVRTDARGRFSLTLAGDPEKAPVFLRVFREGFQLLNEQQLQILPGGPDTVHLIMAANHDLAIARQRYYDLAYSLAVKNLLRRFNEKKQAFEILQNQATADTARINALRQELSAILKQFETIDPVAASFSGNYAVYNLDITPPVFQDAFHLLQGGDPDNAFNLLQTLDLTAQLEREWPQTKPATMQNCTNNPTRPGQVLTKNDLIQLLELKTDLQYIRMELDRVEAGYKTLIHLDSNSLVYHLDFAEFLFDQKRVDEAHIHFEKCLSLATTENDSAFLCMQLAKTWQAAGQIETAAQLAHLGLALSERLVRRDSLQWARYLAMSSLSLGYILHDMQQNSESELLFLNALSIIATLVRTDPEKYEPALAHACMDLGKFYLDMSRKAESEKLILQSQEIFERLANTDPIRYNPNVATTLEILGWIYAGQQKMEDSERYYLRALEWYEQLAQNIPPRFEPLLAETAGYLGELYYHMPDLPESEKMYLRALEIQERYATYDLLRFGPVLGINAMNLGHCCYRMQKIPQAESMYLRCLEAREQLAQTESSQYKMDLANTATWLGKLYIGQDKIPQGEKLLLRAFEILEPLAQRDIEYFGPALASAANDLGVLYAKYTNNPVAENMFFRAVETYTRLVPYDPASIEPKLADATLNLAAFRLENAQFEAGAALGSQSLALLLKYLPAYGVSNQEIYKRAAIVTAALRDSLNAHANFPAAIALQQLRAACVDTLWIYDLAPLHMVAEEYGNLSWQFLFNGQYAEAEQAARYALNLDSSQHWVKTNLGHAFLLRGDLNMAKQVYRDYLDTGGPKAKSMLLHDFDLLEAAAVQHRNLAKARKWLEKE